MDSRATDPSVCGLESVHTAAGRGYADGAAGIGADREVDQLQCNGDRGSAGGPARYAIRCAWIDRRAGPAIDARHPIDKFVHVGLAHDAAARNQERPHHLRMPFGKRRVGEARASQASGHSLDVDGVLHPHPKASAPQIHGLYEYGIGRRGGPQGCTRMPSSAMVTGPAKFLRMDCNTASCISTVAGDRWLSNNRFTPALLASSPMALGGVCRV